MQGHSGPHERTKNASDHGHLSARQRFRGSSLSGRGDRLHHETDTLKQPALIGVILKTLQETGLDPHYLVMELTESVAMESGETLHRKMHDISQMGVQLAIDDFGTGFSSLNYIKQFPIHKLKIDKTFVDNCDTNADDAAIIQTVIALGHALNLKIIAEGVETDDQEAFLRASECDEIQGYNRSKPLSAEKFTAMLESQQFSTNQKNTNQKNTIKRAQHAQHGITDLNRKIHA